MSKLEKLRIFSSLTQIKTGKKIFLWFGNAWVFRVATRFRWKLLLSHAQLAETRHF